ncbi:dihydropteroate synthase [Halogeometricum pallidum JCM 14848]|uniref:Probable bifunctional folylpolyglutamate synthase/dihydropteroate synthase n=1 Tax=Halogeometricum pallidum JCM 14848 TaxID=1227487 RepID=M0DCP9_HALPD|nr:dihydropteroate synthase [Halogeometricum pallidum]ELZ32573.1 dihydropteroate synthase [Halogeometricum pallidum JCM 14848]
MEYHEAVDYLENLDCSSPKLGTETTARMLSALDDPHERVDHVQIAGSNGKGSTAVMLERILREAGLDVGLYTSPDLNDVRERVRINGRKVPKDRVESFVEEIKPAISRLRDEGDCPTYFEVLTVLALQYFGNEDVDVAVLEVGIGGRYDATSVVDPVASAVTSVSLEHTDILGETVQEIARDKAQVAPDGKPLVTSADGEALEAIRSETEVVTVGETDADVVAREGEMSSRIESSVSIAGSDWDVTANLPLLGKHQATNAGVAATLARRVSDVGTPVIERGLRSTHWPGRFEIMSTDPLVVLDGAHNPAACRTVADLLDRYEFDEAHLVFGAMKEKDHAEMAEALPEADVIRFCRPDVSRAASFDALSDAFASRSAETARDRTVQTAVERALDAADEDDCVLITGSLYVVAEARNRWTRLQIPKRVETLDAARSVLTGASLSEEFTGDITTHTFKTWLYDEQAEYLQRLMKRIGGTCVLPKTDSPGRHVPTVLSGTTAQYERLADEVRSGDLGLSHTSDRLREVIDGGEGADGRPWDADTAVMGILNATPDSFYDGGRYTGVEDAVRRVHDMVSSGADIVDVGGESTRPGAEPITVEEEIERVVPVIERISDVEVPISVDTRRAAVADAALDAGADMINDVSGLADPGMRFVAADHDAPIIITHSVDAPVNPNQTVAYDDVVEDVTRELNERVLLAEKAGLSRDQIIVDPGLGFGKSAAECFELIDRLGELRALGCPVLVGHSRKSMFERVDCSSTERLPPTIATTTIAAERGADIVRAHDVAENAAAVRTQREVNGVDR